MEQKNYRDEFEQFLKDCTDDFIMIPARKVWYGIYNDIHPAKRWPSLAIALIMLFSILFVGISNNNAINNATLNKEQLFAANMQANTSIANNESQTITNNPTPQNLSSALNTVAASTLVASKNNLQNNISSNANEIEGNINTNVNNVYTKKNALNSNNGVNKNLKQSVSLSAKETASNKQSKDKAENNEADIATNNVSVITTSKETSRMVFKTEGVIAAQKNTIALNTATNTFPKNEEIKKENKEIIVALNTNEEKAWKEDYAFRNKPKLHFPKPAKTITYYLTPSYGFRTIAKNTSTKSTASVTTSSLLASSTLVNDKEIQNDNAALSLELGAVIKYTVTKNIQFKTGVQVNYTNYVSNASSIGHSTQAKLATANGEEVIGLSSYTTEKGTASLNNTTVQIAIPIGADLKIASFNNVSWYLGATIQPSYTFGGSAFLYSADEKNYITDFSMVRKLNINTAIETFITIKPSSDIIVQLGPQIRYQLFSTYKNEYNYKENLYNLGFKIGVTRTF
jgi:hypothetical protein